MANIIRDKSISRLAAAVTAGFIVLCPLLGASAAKISSVSDALSRSKAGAQSNHQLSFVTPSGIAEGLGFTVSFPPAFGVSGLTEDDVDITDNGVQMTTAPDCSGTEEASVVWSGNALTAAVCAGKGGAIAAGHAVGVSIGTNAVNSGIGANRIVNPSSPGSYRLAVSGSFGDAGEAPVAITADDEVGVTACVGDCFTGSASRPAPIIPSVPPQVTDISVDLLTAATARISWTTDEAANSFVLFGPAIPLTQSNGNDGLAADHSLTLVGLLPDTVYSYKIRSVNLFGDVGWSSLLSFRTLAAANAAKPQISNVRMVSVGSDQVEVAWQTDVPTYWQLEYGRTQYYGNAIYGTQLDTQQQATVGGLSADALYHYRITAIAANGQRAETPDLTFRTFDAQPPKIFDIKAENVAMSSLILSWKTDELATGSVKFGSNQGFLSGESIESGGFATVHRAAIGGLSPGTEYHFQIYETDRFGNDAQSDDFAVKTLAPSLPPNILDLTAAPGDGQVGLSWKNPSTLGFSGVQINRQSGYYPQTPDEGTKVYSGSGTAAVDLGLTNGQAYYYTAWSFNNVGQRSSGALAGAIPRAPVTAQPKPEAGQPGARPSSGAGQVPDVAPKGSQAVGSSQLIVRVQGVPVSMDSGRFTAISGNRVRVTIPQSLSNQPISRATLRVGNNEYRMVPQSNGGSQEAIIVAPEPGDYSSALLIEYANGTSAFLNWQMRVVDKGHIYAAVVANQKPLGTAKITIYDAAGQVWDGAQYEQENPVVTGPDGAYGFYVPKGQYTLKIEKDGYETLTVGPKTFDGPVNEAYSLKAKSQVSKLIEKGNLPKLSQKNVCQLSVSLLALIAGYLIYRLMKRKILGN